eukprot:scaffold104604_cov52-Prasinocladus_malaysianus.AAC.4
MQLPTSAEIVAPGDLVGKLTPSAAEHLSLPAGLPVAQGEASHSRPWLRCVGGADAFIGMIGLGVLNDGGGVGPSDGLVASALGHDWQNFPWTGHLGDVQGKRNKSYICHYPLDCSMDMHLYPSVKATHRFDISSVADDARWHDALIRGLNIVEGGQTSTGSIVNWFRKLAKEDDYSDLNQLAEALPPGSEGLVALDHFQVPCCLRVP